MVILSPDEIQYCNLEPQKDTMSIGYIKLAIHLIGRHALASFLVFRVAQTVENEKEYKSIRVEWSMKKSIRVLE